MGVRICVMNIVSKIRARNPGELNPLWWALIGWALTIGGYGLGEIMIRSFAVGMRAFKAIFCFVW